MIVERWCGAGVKRHIRAVIVVAVLVYCYVAYCLFYKSSAKNSNQSTIATVSPRLWQQGVEIPSQTQTFTKIRNRTINDVFKEHHNQNQSFTGNVAGINEKPGTVCVTSIEFWDIVRIQLMLFYRGALFCYYEL